MAIRAAVMKADLSIASDIGYVFEEGDDYREEEHETHGEQQGPGDNKAAVSQALLHVEVEA